MDTIQTPEQHELTYRGLVQPEPGTLLGPGLDGRQWRVVGAMYDTTKRRTFVTVKAAA